jgi:uncharacterized ion transporter superfamily protein YfcC
MGKVLLTVLVLMLTCSLVIAAGTFATNTTIKGGSKQFKIKVKKLNGEIEEVLHENNNQSTPVTQAELNQIYQSQNGFRYVGVILHAQTNPTCVYILSGNQYKKICW